MVVTVGTTATSTRPSIFFRWDGVVRGERQRALRREYGGWGAVVFVLFVVVYSPSRLTLGENDTVEVDG